MGMSITQETLNKIKSKKLEVNKENKNEISHNINNINNIFNNIYSPIYKKDIKNADYYQKEFTSNNIIIENNCIINDIKKEEIFAEEENNIIFRKHKSINLSSNNLYKSLLLDNNIYNSIINQNYNSEEIYSEKNNESIISDYIDISKKFLSLNRTNKNGHIKSKKIRDSYYHKLIIKNQWNTLKKDKKINNIFFFDWDDTLLCTSFLVPTGALNDMEINKKDKEIISNLDILASNLLSKTISIGHVFIVTNGAPGWVELSSVKFYPNTAKILTKIKIISARGLCEKKLPGDMRQWKINAFKYAIDSIEIKKNIPTNIICFGDSIIEIEASYNIKEYFSNAYLKTIKFKESPSHIELEKELKIILDQLDSILINIKNLSIKVTRKKNE